jgi:hypothetical protein
MLKHLIPWKSFQWGPSCSMRAGGQTGTMKPIIAFRNFVKAPENNRRVRTLEINKGPFLVCTVIKRREFFRSLLRNSCPWIQERVDSTEREKCTHRQSGRGWWARWYYDIFNCNWFDTRWQQYNTHLHTNNTRNNTMRQNTQNGTYITIRIHALKLTKEHNIINIHNNKNL